MRSLRRQKSCNISETVQDTVQGPIAAYKKKHDVLEQQRKQYWSERIQSKGSTPVMLWRSMSTLLQLDSELLTSSRRRATTPHAFQRYFDEKVKTVRAATDGRPPPAISPATAESLSSFSPCSAAEVRKLIMQSPTKSCPLDPIPTFLLKELVDVLLPLYDCHDQRFTARGLSAF